MAPSVLGREDAGGSTHLCVIGFRCILCVGGVELIVPASNMKSILDRTPCLGGGGHGKGSPRKKRRWNTEGNI